MRVDPKACSLVLLVVITACDSPDAQSGAFTVTDSAGVRIVTSAAPIWDEASRWRIENEPELSIGVATGSTEYIFTRVAGAGRLPDGTIAVGDYPTNEIRYYDPAGQFLRKVGRTGEGPGEFKFLRELMRCARDTIYGFDTDWPVEVYDGTGRFIRTLTFEPPESFVVPSPYMVSCNQRGQFLINGWGREVTERRSPGRYRTTSPLALFAADGSVLRDLGYYPGAERLRDVGSPYPMGKYLVHGLGDDLIYVGTADRYEIQVLDLTGALTAIYRRDTGPLTYDEMRLDDWATLETQRDPGSADHVERTRTAVAKYDKPEILPAYSRFLIDKTGHLWVEDFFLPGEPLRSWSVFRADGVWLGTVEVPVRFEIKEISGDRVLGVTRDDLGVERVVSHRLMKP
jgi:hypothetical protein